MCGVIFANVVNLDSAKPLSKWSPRTRRSVCHLSICYITVQAKFITSQLCSCSHNIRTLDQTNQSCQLQRETMRVQGHLQPNIVTRGVSYEDLPAFQRGYTVEGDSACLLSSVSILQ